MPMRIRTPEDIFRAERRDVYALSFLENTPEAIEKTWQDMQVWLTQHLPDSPTEAMAPSEHSGYLTGGPITLRVAFTEVDLQRFCAQWETPIGLSVDPRFQCNEYPYLTWLGQHGHFSPTVERPHDPGVSVWIESPLGILNHVLPPEHNLHPATARDLWVNACQLLPGLQAHDLDELNVGRVCWDSAQPNYTLLWNAPFPGPIEIVESHWRGVADWLRLPPDANIGSEF